MSLTWDGKAVDTIGELLDTAIVAMHQGRAPGFYDAYRATNEHAAENLGYVFGYCDESTRKELYAAYDVAHPVFGQTFGRTS